MNSILWDGTSDVPYSCDNNRYLFINSCSVDHYNMQSADEFVLDRKREDWYLVYFTKGVAYAEFDGNQHKVSEGDILMYEPGMFQKIVRKKSGKACNYYAHFTGYAVKDMMNDCGLTHSGIYKTGGDPLIEETFAQLIAAYTSGSGYPHINYLFSKLLMHISESLSSTQKNAEANYKASGKIMNGLTRLDFEGIMRDSKIEYYAKISNYGSSQFVKSFKEIMGKTPKKHVMDKRIKKARELLLSTSLSITEIATSIGYKDPLYFSRIFKKYVGMSPREFRKSGEKKEK